MAVKPLWIFITLVLLVIAWRWRGGGRVLRGLLTVIAIPAGLFAFGVIHPPTIDEIVKQVGHSLGKWAYLVVGVNAFLETGAFLGFIAPGETVVLFGGVLAGEGTLDLNTLILIACLSAFAGDITAYTIGRRAGREFLLKHGRRVRVGETQVAFVERVFARRGRVTLLLGRWVGVVRPLVPFLAGASKMRLWEFLIIDLISVAAWSIGLCVVGSIFWQNFDQLVSLVSQALFILGTVIVLSIAIGAGVSAWRDEERRSHVERWLAEQTDEHPVIARPLVALWRAVGLLSARLPGGERDATTDPADTVAQGAAPVQPPVPPAS